MTKMLKLHAFRSDGEYRFELFAALPGQLRDYFSKFPEYRTLHSLSTRDLNNDARYSLKMVRTMRVELRTFEQLVLNNDIKRPPEFVEDGKDKTPSLEFGMNGLTEFCQDLDKVLAKGIESGDGIVLVED